MNTVYVFTNYILSDFVNFRFVPPLTKFTCTASYMYVCIVKLRIRPIVISLGYILVSSQTLMYGENISLLNKL